MLENGQELLYPQEPVVESVPAPEPVPEQPKESDRERNIRIMAQRAEAAERRAAELERQIQMNMAQNQPSQKLQLQDDDDIDISDDSYVEGKQIKKYIKALKAENKAMKKEWEEDRQRNALSTAEVRLNSQFKDFDSVVNTSTLEKLKYNDPVLYESIMASPDIYKRGYTAYKLIKSSGLDVDHFEKEDKRIEDNRSKPRSSANAAPQSSDTPLARVGDYDRRVLTEAQKRENIKRAREYASMKQ